MYATWQKWADPDVGQASVYMKRLVTDKDYYDAVSRSAKEHIRKSFSPEICGQRMKNRLSEISNILENGYSANKNKLAQIMSKVCVSCFENLAGIQMTPSERENLAVLWQKDNMVDFDRIAEKISTSNWGKTVSDTEFVKGLYTKILCRIPEEEEIMQWINVLTTMDRTQVVFSFLKSDEFLGDYAGIYKNVDTANYIHEDYNIEQSRAMIQNQQINQFIHEDCGIDQNSVMTQELQQINQFYDASIKGFDMIPEEILNRIDEINTTMMEELHQANLLYVYSDSTEGHGEEKILETLIIPIIKWLEQYNAHVIRCLNSMQEKSILYDQNIQALSGQIEYNAHVTRYLNEVQKKIAVSENINENLQQLHKESICRINNTENTYKEILKVLHEVKQQLDDRNNELKEYINIGNDELKNQLNVRSDELEEYVNVGNDKLKNQLSAKNNELKEQVNTRNDELKNQLNSIALEFDKCMKTEFNNIKNYVNFGYSEIKTSVDIMGEEIKNHINTKNEQIRLNSIENKNTLIEVDGSRHNQVIHYLTEIIDGNNPKTLNNSVNLIKEAIRGKWMLVDSYEQKMYNNHKLSCPICGNSFETDNVSRLVSECIFNGGRLIRYVCPYCGVVFGPEKMLHLNDETFSNEYKIHYSVYSEGDATQREIQVFRQIDPNIDGIYLDWGVGAWSTVISSLREEGYQVYGYDPYAPVDSEYVITSETQLRKMKFDGIFSHDLLEHLKDPIGTFKLFSEILKPEGRMVHSTACYDYVYEYTRFHLFFYTGTSIEEICKQTGFIIDSTTKDPINLEISYSYRKVP